ncbi:MAG: Wzz/FepE/Etk N-terminal domain-containing protein, partial [Synergistaceae bacterium]|nr:Wzz/FepE/Etk N-terminal domain-containing protein [Synergistaceae bacterium]
MAEDRNFVEIQDDAEEISLLDILLIIAEGKGLILKTIAAFVVVGLAYALFFTTPQYSATMQMLPLIALNPTPEVVTMSVPANLVSGIVQSDRTYDGVIDKLNLMERDGKTIDRNAARRDLKKAIKVEIGGEGIVTVNAKDESPKMVVDILNTVYSESASA